MVSCHQSKRLTWSELLDAADRVAHGLAKLGVEPADRVGLWAMNCWEWLVVHMACARAGAILVNVNPSCRAHELAFILTKSRMKVLFLRERDAKANYADSARRSVQGSGTSLCGIRVFFDTPAWESLLAEEPQATTAHIELDDATNIQYTSGTTGSPKGVLLTPPQSGQQRLPERARAALHRTRPHLSGGALRALLRQRDRHHVGAGERVRADFAE